MSKVKAWKHGEKDAPFFPDDYSIVKKAALQVTDLKTNRNKYYAIELQTASDGGVTFFRVFTHYGRTDDLENNPHSGQKECRYFEDAIAAERTYASIYREKTSPAKGYRELSLAASSIGSDRARGQSSGEIDSRTLERLAAPEDAEPPPKPKFDLHPRIRELVSYLFSEATNALTATVNAKITANGIQTPLGVLTIGQVEKGEAILKEAYELFQLKGAKVRSRLEDLSGEFYTVVPHRIGRSREAIAQAVLDSLEAFAQKQETLQLMKDMLQVNGERGSVLYDAESDSQFESLGVELAAVERHDPEHEKIERYVVESQIKTKSLRVRNIYKVSRPGERDRYENRIGNDRLLFHGSRIQNWVGLLTRGIVLPKLAVKLGVNRTDAGWLGNGIYFGDAACTSAFYTTPGRKQTRVLAIASVALGKVKGFHKITYGLDGPPPGYDSCHGVRRKLLTKSQFDDDEYVIYRETQQRMDYLVEFTV